MLEFWFPFSQIERTRRLGTWCDGIPLLYLVPKDRVTISMCGVGYFPYQLAPFETEWRFRHRRDRIPISIILRLGYVAREKEQSFRPHPHLAEIYNSRPTQTADWMIAVELTEP